MVPQDGQTQIIGEFNQFLRAGSTCTRLEEIRTVAEQINQNLGDAGGVDPYVGKGGHLTLRMEAYTPAANAAILHIAQEYQRRDPGAIEYPREVNFGARTTFPNSWALGIRGTEVRLK